MIVECYVFPFLVDIDGDPIPLEVCKRTYVGVYYGVVANLVIAGYAWISGIIVKSHAAMCVWIIPHKCDAAQISIIPRVALRIEEYLDGHSPHLGSQRGWQIVNCVIGGIIAQY